MILGVEYVEFFYLFDLPFFVVLGLLRQKEVLLSLDLFLYKFFNIFMLILCVFLLLLLIISKMPIGAFTLYLKSSSN